MVFQPPVLTAPLCGCHLFFCIKLHLWAFPSLVFLHLTFSSSFLRSLNIISRETDTDMYVCFRSSYPYVSALNCDKSLVGHEVQSGTKRVAVVRILRGSCYFINSQVEEAETNLRHFPDKLTLTNKSNSIHISLFKDDIGRIDILFS